MRTKAELMNSIQPKMNTLEKLTQAADIENKSSKSKSIIGRKTIESETEQSIIG